MAALCIAVSSATKEEEKELYLDRLYAMWEMLEFKPGSMNNNTLRWQFLDEISKEFDWKGKSWSVIEEKRSGERIRILNYLIYYHEKHRKIIVYDYYAGKWEKLKERTETFKTKSLIEQDTKVSAFEGGNFSDVIVTDFKSALPLQSMYFIEGTIKEHSSIHRIISRR